MNVVSEMDLDFIQGYLYGKPEAAEQFYQMYLQAGQAQKAIIEKQISQIDENR